MVCISDALFLIPLFEALKRSEIRYAVLRNAGMLPNSLGGGDIDMLFHPTEFARGVETIRKTIRECGGTILAQAHSPYYLQIMAIGRQGSTWWGVCLDLFEGVRYTGAMPLIDNAVLDARVLSPSGVYALDDNVADLLGVIKEFVYNGVVSDRYREGASRALESSDTLTYFTCLGCNGIGELKDALAQAHSKTACRRSAKRFRRLLAWRSVTKNPYHYFKNIAAFHLSKVGRLLAPPGKVVAVLGTDGAGKSTVLAAIRPLLMSATHKAFRVQHLKPDLLPPLAYLKGRKTVSTGPVTDPHGSTPSGFLGSLFRLLYLVADYVLGYWLKVVPLTAKIPTALYVFDRYAYDILLDPKRFRISLPQWIIRLALVCVPRPDLIICLVGDPGVIAERKKELPMAEVCRQVAALTRFAETKHSAVLISTTRPLGETCQAVLEAIQVEKSMRAGSSVRTALSVRQ